ncbi:hypothetical protein RHSIM_Rhsim04G0084000 [Rhododendron simsii]|uniref:Uncharacterized protein n=1 Tax=Rhododendron simsii TaxID=118357 RepID=A0A834H3H0_RHOSS|nr:hypothetical protein RHSIM_Rhsim04G0084000 [Rhododendron simsii]
MEAAAAELVFIPSPGMGHLVATVEMAKQLIGRNHRLSITVLIMKIPFDKSKVSSSTQSLLLTAAGDRLKFVYLPQDEAALAELRSEKPGSFMSEFVNMNKQHVRDHVTKMISTGSSRVVGFVVDVFCTPMMDTAAEFGIPTYVFFTSSCAFLGLMFHLDTLSRGQDVTELKDSDPELEVPVFVNPVPVKVLPSVVLDKEGGSTYFLSIAKKLKETKGIMVNTFEELESYAVKHLAEDDKIVRWLDDQPPSSVVFLCFGSMGGFESDQVREIARALEQSGHRFLWSIRQPPQKGEMERKMPRLAVEIKLDYKNDLRFASINVKLVTADEIKNAISKLMEKDDQSSEGIKQKVKEMGEKCKIVVKEGGSSYNSVGRFIEDVMNNTHSC